jgi:hypothetical protein
MNRRRLDRLIEVLKPEMPRIISVSLSSVDGRVLSVHYSDGKRKVSSEMPSEELTKLKELLKDNSDASFKVYIGFSPDDL